jgi:hypothetical protein
MAGHLMALTAFLVQPNPGAAALHVNILHAHFGDGADAREGEDHQRDQGAIAQACRRAGVDRIEQPNLITPIQNAASSYEGIGLVVSPYWIKNEVRLNGYSVPVELSGSATFDVSKVDVSSLRLGPAGASVRRTTARIKDLNKDGFPDMVVTFNPRDLGLVQGDTSLTLTGETADGKPFPGSAAIVTKP